MLHHLPDDLLRECARLRGAADQHVRLELANHSEQIRALALPLLIVHREGLLTVREILFHGLKQQPRLVDTQDLAAGLLSRNLALGSDGVPDLICDPCACASEAEDHEPQVLDRLLREVQSGRDRCQRDASGPLHVVVEHRSVLGIPVQKPPSVTQAEVLEVDDGAGVEFADGLDERVHEPIVLRPAAHALLPQAQIQRIIEQTLAISTAVQHHRQRAIRMQSRAEGAQREFRRADEDPAHALVADPQDLLRVGYHDVVDVVRLAPLRQVLAHALGLVDGQEAAFGLAEDVRVLLDGGAFGGGVAGWEGVRQWWRGLGGGRGGMGAEGRT